MGAMGTSARKSYRAGKASKVETESCDATMPMDSHEANVAMAVAREGAQSQEGQVEQRMMLMEMATKLRVALFAEVSKRRGLSSTVCVGTAESGFSRASMAGLDALGYCSLTEVWRKGHFFVFFR